jgi:formamidopyrimidine-DNA glycosylase
LEFHAGGVPELPEVETTRRFIEPVLTGARLERVEVRRPRTARRNLRPEDVSERLTGRRVLAVKRRGKFILTDVEGDLTWVTHLGMSGRMQIAEPGEVEAPHTNAVFATDGQVELRFVDPRTFGFVAVFTPDELEYSGLDRIGRDALTDLPSVPEFAAAFAGRIPVIKSALLDQRFIAGLGNIYADEVLHRARVHPARQIGSLDLDEVTRIRQAIVPVLAAGVAHGGTSLNDLAYLLPDGRAGEFLQRLGVYGRQGEPCRTCGTPIERLVIAQRSSHFCPSCQPLAD